MWIDRNSNSVKNNETQLQIIMKIVQLIIVFLYLVLWFELWNIWFHFGLSGFLARLLTCLSFPLDFCCPSSFVCLLVRDLCAYFFFAAVIVCLLFFCELLGSCVCALAIAALLYECSMAKQIKDVMLVYHKTTVVATERQMSNDFLMKNTLFV